MSWSPEETERLSCPSRRPHYLLVLTLAGERNGKRPSTKSAAKETPGVFRVAKAYTRRLSSYHLLVLWTSSPRREKYLQTHSASGLSFVFVVGCMRMQGIDASASTVSSHPPHLVLPSRVPPSVSCSCREVWHTLARAMTQRESTPCLSTRQLMNSSNLCSSRAAYSRVKHHVYGIQL